MGKEKKKRTTIRDIADAVGIAPSSVSKALNDLPTISANMKTLVRAKAIELNYKHNSHAANLRRGSSRTIGVIVPKINVAFFADVISGIEQTCFENDHGLIICQSEESFVKEAKAIETLIQQNVDCILISLSQETKSIEHLKEVSNHHIHLIQFDRVDESLGGHMLVNDNHKASCKAVNHLISQGYKSIAFLGGPDNLPLYKERKQGFLDSIKKAGLVIPYNFIVDNILKKETAQTTALELLKLNNPPDAFFTVSDYAALGVLKAAELCHKKVPEDIGIIGFSNEFFTEVMSPTLSTISQQSKKMGQEAANIYFEHILNRNGFNKESPFFKKVIESSIIIRQSSSKKMN